MFHTLLSHLRQETNTAQPPPFGLRLAVARVRTEASWYVSMIRRTNGASWKRTIAWIVTKPYRLRQWPVDAKMSLGISKFLCWWEKNPAITSWYCKFIPLFTRFLHHPRWLVRISSVNSMEVVKAMLPTISFNQQWCLHLIDGSPIRL